VCYVQEVIMLFKPFQFFAIDWNVWIIFNDNVDCCLNAKLEYQEEFFKKWVKTNFSPVGFENDG